MNRFARILVVAFFTLLVPSALMTFWVEAATEDSWTSKPPIQSFPNGVAVVNGKIYTFSRSETFEYDPNTNVWLAKKPLPTPRSSFGIAVYENKIYVIGGWVYTDLRGVPFFSPANEVYDPLTDTWETKAPMPTPRGQLDANVVNGKIYLIGGMIQGDIGTPTNLNEVYDLASDSWTTKAPMPTGVYAYASAVVDNKIYFIGGAGPKPPNLNQIYDHATDTWSLGNPVPNPVVDTAAGATTGVWAPKRIYVIGGRINYGMDGNSLNQVYNPENDSWTVGAPMPTARFGLRVAVVNDIVYAMGGWDSFLGSSCSELEQYTPIGYGTALPAVAVVSPENKTYNATSVSLIFTVNKPVVWMGYSLDGQETVTITGNTTLSGLANGLHNITVYAGDEFENMGTSETITFSIEVPFPTILVVTAFGVAVAIIGVGLLIYFTHVKRSKRSY